MIQVFPLIVLNGFTSIGRIFIFKQWLPERKIHNDFAKKLVAFVLIPVIFLGLFFIVYSFGSDHFSSLFTDYELDINLPQLIAMCILGFYISFSFWNYWVPDVCYEYNPKLNNDFTNISEVKNQSTFSFLDLDFERKSGEITLVLLNIMLLVFIGTYNYEQFFEVVKKTNLSSDIHERVNAVIFSILMAVGVILFYFKGGFNFDEKASSLKKLAKLWITLNVILIISAIIKNSEYVSFYGLTYKRLGVYAFLILAIIGLVVSLQKIRNQKTNAYLFNQMIWYFYGTILLCSYVNWGSLITNYNISVNKGVEPVFLSGLNFNDDARREYLRKNNLDGKYAEAVREELISNYQNANFLSKALYYEFLNEKNK
ncbi:putative membrane protein SirB2 [Flavobacterium sp. SORGH_AS 622]|nr:putative membrane protein SirB2 [Flavobacterium sp. SORGH_AS_0622]